MTFRSRLIVVAFLAMAVLALYGFSRYHTPTLVAYVVEQALLQKLPPEADSSGVHARLHSLLSSIPGRQAKLERLLLMSQYLEKLQSISVRELEELFGSDARVPGQARD